MSNSAVRIIFAFLAAAYVLTHFAGHAHAASSLGIGTNEAVLPSTGLFYQVTNWINAQQQGFYRQLTQAMKAIKTDGAAMWLLVGLSFAYGVFHAAGPGHGKAVISSYMLANEVALRRGVMLSFVSAFLQAATAIVLMTLVYFVLRGTSISMTDATNFLETASYALIALFGAWLLWKKAGIPLLRRLRGSPAHSLSAASVAAHRHDHAAHDHDHDHHDHHDHSHHDHAHHDHAPHGHANPAHGEHGHVHDDHCGHSHAPDPMLLSGERFDWRAAWSAVAAVGIRPCSGALIVLTFAFLNGLWLAGIASVLAMAVGTAITVSAMATIAVLAKNWAVALAGDGHAGNRIHRTIEIGGALFILLIGVTLFAASLQP